MPSGLYSLPAAATAPPYPLASPPRLPVEPPCPRSPPQSVPHWLPPAVTSRTPSQMWQPRLHPKLLAVSDALQTTAVAEVAGLSMHLEIAAHGLPLGEWDRPYLPDCGDHWQSPPSSLTPSFASVENPPGISCGESPARTSLAGCLT